MELTIFDGSQDSSVQSLEDLDRFLQVENLRRQLMTAAVPEAVLVPAIPSCAAPTHEDQYVDQYVQRRLGFWLLLSVTPPRSLGTNAPAKGAAREIG